VSGRGLSCPLSHVHGWLAQLIDHLSRVETTCDGS
jgi:hypothetical protein